MKKIIIGLVLLTSTLSFAETEITKLALLSKNYDLKTVVENAFGSEIEMMEYAEDGESLNVYHDNRVCHNITLKELESGGVKSVVVTGIRRDVTCDK